jgi:hypothetical protein
LPRQEQDGGELRTGGGGDDDDDNDDTGSMTIKHAGS